MSTIDQHLQILRKQYADRLAQAGEDFRRLQAEIGILKGKITAIDTLTNSSEQEDPEQEAEISDTVPEEADDLALFTPVHAYWKPILQVLVESGGRARRGKVVDAVGEKMKGILKPTDYGKLPKSGWIRWRNRVAWQASDMRTPSTGFIRNDSPRGIWEITDAGRKWLDDANT